MAILPPKPAITGNLGADIETDIKNTHAASTAGGGVTGSILPPLPGGKIDLNALWAKLQSVSITDLEYALALANATKTDGAAMRAKLWTAWIALIQAQQGANAVDASGKPLGPKPDPSAFATFEQLAQVVDSLQPTSPFMQAATPVANAFKQDVLQLVTMVVSGTTALGALGVAIP